MDKEKSPTLLYCGAVIVSLIAVGVLSMLLNSPLRNQHLVRRQQSATEATAQRNMPPEEKKYYQSGHIAAKVLETLDQSKEVQQQRKSFISMLLQNGFIQKTENKNNVPAIWVTDKFIKAGKSMQEDFMGMIFAYYMVEDARNQTIVIRNAGNEKIGEFTAIEGLVLTR